MTIRPGKVVPALGSTRTLFRTRKEYRLWPHSDPSETTSRRAYRPMATYTAQSEVSALRVRRDKAALSSGCEPHPATAPAGNNRSSHGGDKMAGAFGVAGHI